MKPGCINVYVKTNVESNRDRINHSMNAPDSTDALNGLKGIAEEDFLSNIIVSSVW